MAPSIELKPAPRWVRGLEASWKRLGLLLADAILLAYLFVISSYCYTRIASGIGDYLIVPWWVLLLATVELAVLWETFGTSIAMRVSSLVLLDRDSRPAPFARRVVRYLLWHVSILGLLNIHAHWSRTRISAPTESHPLAPWYRSTWGWSLILLLAVTFVAGGYITKVNLHSLLTGAGKTAIVWRRLIRPDWSLLSDGLSLLIVTLFMALMATIFGIVFAVPLSFLAARNLMRGRVGRAVYTFVRALMSIIRSIEPIIWAILFVVWVRVGAFPGVLALFVHSVADLTKLYSERLESIDPGPAEAITATGGNRIQVILYGIIPQIINPYLSFTLYRWDINVRMATIIGVVGGGGIGQNLYQYTRLWDWEAAGMMMLLIIVAVWAIDYLSARLRARLN
jgi:phosphonate transport system permease protein